MAGKAKAGELREIVVIQRKSIAASTEDDHGQVADDYADLASRPREAAKVVAVSAAMVEQAAQIVGKAVFLVEIRYRTDVTSDCRVKWLTNGSSTPPYLYVMGVPADPYGTKERITFLAVQSDVPVEP
jgi:head-tail adaptor